MKEIITIQIGGYANFVGSHFWNFQDELLGLESEPGGDPVYLNSGINSSVLYRVGETRQGVPTYTPRLLAIDSRGSLGAVRASGSLYQQPPSVESSLVTSWQGKTVKHKAEPIPKNEFLQSLESEEFEWRPQAGMHHSGLDNKELKSGNGQKRLFESLENNVQFWTDYSKVHFHPLSLFEVEGLWHGITPFDDFGSGKGLLTGSIQEEAQDRLRFFVEESDRLQGLQLLVDDSNGFAGISVDFLETIADDYSQTPFLMFSTRSPSSFRKPKDFNGSTRRALHDAISFSQLSCYSQCMIPLGLPSIARSEVSKYLQVNDSQDFHTSAVYGAAVSCISLPLRMEFSGPSASACQIGIGGTDMASFLHALSGQTGRRVSILDLAMPAPLVPGVGKQESFDFNRFQPLIPDVNNSNDTEALEALVVQGALRADSVGCASIDEVVNSLYRCQQESPLSICHLAVSLCPFAIPLPFPKFFGPCIGQRGEVTKPRDPARTELDVFSIPLATRLRTSAAILPYLESRLHNIQHFGLSKGSHGRQIVEEWGLQKDELQELCEVFSKTVAAYGGDMGATTSDSD